MRASASGVGGGGLLVLLISIALTPQPVWGQYSPLLLDIRGGASLPVAAFGEAQGRPNTTLRPAESVTVRFELGGGGPWGVMVGFSQERAGCRGPACEPDERWATTSWVLGGRWVAPTGPARPWLSAALLVPTVEWDSDARERVSDTALGAEVGGGVRLRLGERWSTGPAIRYARHAAEFRRDGRWPIRSMALEWALTIGF